ncbi:MAG: hypothetical protein QXV27_05965 [Candidatus Caldarchaeum sp.]
MKCSALIAAFIILVSLAPQPSFGQQDYRVLPIRAPLNVVLVFIDVDPAWFGASNINQLLEDVSAGVRETAKSALDDSGSIFAPFEFDVQLSAREFRLIQLEEFRLSLRSLNLPAPRELLEAKGVRGSIASIHAPTALKMLVDLSRRHYPDILDDHVIFFICGARALGSAPIYHTFGQLPETGKYGGELPLNMYGGVWYGRYVFVDLCALSQYEDYPPIQNLDTARERLALLTTYVDEIIDMQFVKSTIYVPRYRLQVLVDVLVVDATRAGLNFELLVDRFDLEAVEQSLKTLTPYNLYTFTVRHVRAADVPGFMNIVKLDQANNKALVEASMAYDLLKRANKLSPGEGDYQYVPAIVVVTDYNTRVYLKDPEDDALGIALPDPDDSRFGAAAVAGASYYLLSYEGLAATVAHEIGHVLGLRHPHDDFDEAAGRDVRSMIYTKSIETYMGYSTTWVEAVKRRTVREGYYPIKTYWSIFDLDAIDRAIISILLSTYEQNYREIVDEVSKAGLRLDDMKTLTEALNTAKILAKRSVELFRSHNYLDRLEYTGLGAQLKSSFDYAFMAMALTELSKTYTNGLIVQNERLRPQIESLQAEISSLTATLNRVKQETERTAEELKSVEEAVKKSLETNEALMNRIKMLSEEAAQLEQLRSRRAELDRRLGEEGRRLSELTAEVGGLRTTIFALTALTVVLVAAAAALVVFFRKKL